MSYWFYAYPNVTGYSGLANLANVHSMAFAFVSNTSLVELDLRGFDPSSLTSLQYTFSGCTALTTILVDSTWAPPSTVSGMQTFYNCKALVGGNGTAWSSSNTGYKCCVIDAAGSPGYLTVG